MKTIWKFPFNLAQRVGIMMPTGAKLISVAPQDDTICVWAIVDPDARRVTRELSVYGTGHPMRPETHDDRHVGTVHVGPFVWHIFDEGER